MRQSSNPMSIQTTAHNEIASLISSPIGHTTSLSSSSMERYDESELCSDILGFWNLNATDHMLPVRGKPSDPRNWEVTESFTKKWGWAIHGCPE
ncbi:hypothetical protein BDV34DRAFT_176262 [Aspergillus parasiticus]|uniref:Uncharacterized protein n=1 Tax=Aspergillus parasiticus TaxID=5067 RepID=A0A5N6DZL3_ASPPA|nr:hypothetical protein BDV34DRAFT_176262 [Aspergillus parasiticus]